MFESTLNERQLSPVPDLEDETPADALSLRELQVLNLVADGLTNCMIGQRLSVSENTVKYHLKNVMQKLHLHNRAQAAAFAAQQGWLGHRIRAG
jgi:DNA-binding NarL/FixJ family response regulator